MNALAPSDKGKADWRLTVQRLRANGS